MTHLDTVAVAPDRTGLDRIVEKIRPDGADRHRFATSINAGTVEDQIGRYRALADAGVSTAIVALADLGSPEPIERFAAVIDAFSGDKQQPGD